MGLVISVRLEDELLLDRGNPGATAAAPVAAVRRRTFAWRPVFPHRHMAFATLGLCDFVLTCLILSLGGEESNAFALWVVQRFSLAGAAVYKLSFVVAIIGLIEWIAPRNRAAARRLANYSLIITALPVAFGLFVLGVDMALMAGLPPLP